MEDDKVEKETPLAARRPPLSRVVKTGVKQTLGPRWGAGGGNRRLPEAAASLGVTPVPLTRTW